MEETGCETICGTPTTLAINVDDCDDDSVRPVGTTLGDCQRFIMNVFLKASSSTTGLGRFHDWTWGCRDSCILHGLVSQRVAWEKKYQVPSSSLWGVVCCKGAATSLVPKVILSSSVSVFFRLRLRLSLPLYVSVVVPGGWSRGRRRSVRCSTSRVWKPMWGACSKCVRYFVECAVSSKFKGLCGVVMSSHN